MLPFCFAASWLLRMPTLSCAPCRSGDCSATESSTEQHRAGQRRGTRTVQKARHLSSGQKAREVRCKKDPCKHALRTRMHPSYRACERHVAHSKGLPACWLAAGCWPAPRLAHEHTRAEHARHARTTRVRLASDAHALTLQHALTSNLSCRARVTGHWLTVGRRATGGSRIRMLSNLTRHPPLMRAAFINTHVVHAIHHLRLPCLVLQRINHEQRDDSE